jgi:hypothetical protein
MTDAEFQKLVAETMNEKITQWNQIERDLQTLWENSGKPHGAAWKKIAARLWGQQDNLEKDFTPLLFEWAEKNGCGQFRDDILFGVRGWFPEKGGYQKIKEHTGIEASSREIRRLLISGWWFASGEKDKWEKFVRSMSDAEFDEYINNYCTASVEGYNTKRFLLKLRAAYKKEKSR